MEIEQPTIYYFAPDNATRTSLANYAADFRAALEAEDGIRLKPVFDRNVVENLSNYSGAVSYVREQLQRRLGKRRRPRGNGPDNAPAEIIHGELSRLGYREFWGMYFAARAMPQAPLCVVFHDPPALPMRIGRAAEVSGRKRRFLDGFISRLTARLAELGQRRVEEVFLERATVLLAPSRHGAFLLADRFPEYRYKIGTIPPLLMGPPPGQPPAREKKRREIINITCLGHIHPDRALEELIDACILVHKRHSLIGKVFVRIRGRIPPRVQETQFDKRIQERIKALGAGWLVDFKPGAVPEKAIDSLLEETDILVIPHRAHAECNGFSRTLMRAGQWRVALVASKVGSIPEMLRDNREALLYEPGDVNRLSRRLESLIRDDALRLKLADNLREGLLERHHRPDIVKSLVDLYYELLAARDENRLPQLPEAFRVFEPRPGPQARAEAAPDEAGAAAAEGNARG